MKEFDPFFLSAMLAKLAEEFVPYEPTGRWYTANEIREVRDVIDRLKTIADRHGYLLSSRNEKVVQTCSNHKAIIFRLAANSNDRQILVPNPTDGGGAA